MFLFTIVKRVLSAIFGRFTRYRHIREVLKNAGSIQSSIKWRLWGVNLFVLGGYATLFSKYVIYSNYDTLSKSLIGAGLAISYLPVTTGLSYLSVKRYINSDKFQKQLNEVKKEAGKGYEEIKELFPGTVTGSKPEQASSG